MFKPAGFCLRVLLVISRRMDYNKSSNKLLHKEDMDMQAKYVVKKVSAPDWETIPAVTLTHTPWLTPNAVEAKAQACHRALFGKYPFVCITRPVNRGTIIIEDKE